MKRLSKHEVNKLTALELKNRLPFEVVSDGEVIAVMIPATDVNKLKANHDVNMTNYTSKSGELRFSKAKQGKGRLSSA